MKKRKTRIYTILILLLLISILLINSIVSNFIEKKLTNIIHNKESKEYTVRFKKVHFNVFSGSLSVKGISLDPKIKSNSDLNSEMSSNKPQYKISLSSIKISGIQLLKLLFNKNILINKLILTDLFVQKFNTSKSTIKKDNTKKPINLDSIYIKEFNGLQIDKIKINKFTYHVINSSNDEIIFQSSPVSFELERIALKKYQDDLFKLEIRDNQFNIKNINVEFEKTQYSLSMGSITIDTNKDNINIKNLIYKPLKNKYVVANSYKYNSEVYSLDVNEIHFFNFNLSKAVTDDGIYIDSISVNKFNLDIFKDQRKPFDYKKRPKLPHIALKQMESPLNIKKIIITNSFLSYEEKLENKKILMKVNFSDINTQITNISSIKEWREDPLRIEFHSKLMNESVMNVNLLFPLKDNENTFYINGKLGSADFRYFDSAIIPALGIKVLSGRLDAMTFEAKADSYSSHGTMTMLYHNLKAEVFKTKTTGTNDFLSWTVNHVVHRSNPGAKDKTREAVLYYERTNYKGIGNYLWKTLQSGITNTIAPIGKTTEKVQAKENRKSKRKLKKQQRHEKRTN